MGTLGKILAAICWGIDFVILSPALHIWTIIIAYETKGLFSAIISGMIPIGSQIYWIIYIYKVDGNILNLFTLLCVLWVILLILGYIGAFLKEEY